MPAPCATHSTPQLRRRAWPCVSSLSQPRPSSRPLAFCMVDPCSLVPCSDSMLDVQHVYGAGIAASNKASKRQRRSPRWRMSHPSRHCNHHENGSICCRRLVSGPRAPRPLASVVGGQISFPMEKPSATPTAKHSASRPSWTVSLSSNSAVHQPPHHTQCDLLAHAPPLHVTGTRVFSQHPPGSFPHVLTVAAAALPRTRIAVPYPTDSDNNPTTPSARPQMQPLDWHVAVLGITTDTCAHFQQLAPARCMSALELSRGALRKTVASRSTAPGTESF